VFCTKCGIAISNTDNFCPKCGTKTINQHGLEQVEKSRLEKFGTIGNKIGIIGGIIVLLSGISISDLYSIFMGISLFIVGFVNLKTKSKTIQQFTGIIGLVLLIAAIINLAK